MVQQQHGAELACPCLAWQHAIYIEHMEPIIIQSMHAAKQLQIGSVDMLPSFADVKASTKTFCIIYHS